MSSDATTLAPDIQDLIKAACQQQAKQAVSSLTTGYVPPVESMQAAIDNYVVNGSFHHDVWDVEMQPLRKNSDTFFLLIMAFFIYYMEVGFMLLEVGMVRTKNVTNALLKNASYSFTQALGFFVAGYAISFGKSLYHFVGANWWGWKSDPEVPDYAFWVFQYVFACTSGAVVTGAIAERAQIVGYLIYTVWASACTYPFIVHWTWNPDGWLKLGGSYTIDGSTFTVGFEDFAGSGVVHIGGGAATLIYILVLGPRIGRFKPNGESNDMPAHNLTLVSIGALILYNGFLAFNAGSQTSISNAGDYLPVARAAANTVITGAAGFITDMLLYRVVYKRWLLMPALCGGLAGCVAACASCNIVEGWAACCIGILAGLVYMGGSAMMRRLRIDDAVDAVPVHWGGGICGCLALAFFKIDTGILYTWNKRSAIMLGWQLCGVVAITLWTFFNTYTLCILLKLFNMLRVDRETELRGLDWAHGHEDPYQAEAYVDGIMPEMLPLGLPPIIKPQDRVENMYPKYPPVGVYHPWPGVNKDWHLLDLSGISITVRHRPVIVESKPPPAVNRQRTILGNNAETKSVKDIIDELAG